MGQLPNNRKIDVYVSVSGGINTWSVHGWCLTPIDMTLFDLIRLAVRVCVNINYWSLKAYKYLDVF